MVIRSRKNCTGCDIRFTPEHDGQKTCGECATWIKPEPELHEVPDEAVDHEFSADAG